MRDGIMSDKLTEQEIFTALLNFYTEDEARLWLVSSNKLLGDKPPCNMIDAGRGDEVLRLLHQLSDGVYL